METFFCSKMSESYFSKEELEKFLNPPRKGGLTVQALKQRFGVKPSYRIKRADLVNQIRDENYRKAHQEMDIAVAYERGFDDRCRE